MQVTKNHQEEINPKQNIKHVPIIGKQKINQSITEIFDHCQRLLMIRAPTLAFDFYHGDAFSSSCLSIITGNLHNRILFLLDDEQHLQHSSLRLIQLARKYSSYIKIKILPLEYKDRQDMFMVCDSHAYLHQPQVEYARAFVNFNDPGSCKHFSLRFKGLWERSRPPSEIFTLGL